MEGYIKLSRHILEDPIYLQQPFDEAHAMVDIFLLANWCASRAMNGSDVVTIHRGELGRSLTWWADRWGWSRHKVTSFLKKLEKKQTIVLNRTPNGTVISVENYNKYQGDGTGDGTSMGHQWDISGTYINNNKNNKKERSLLREIKQREPIKYSVEESSQILSQAHSLFMEMNK